MKEKQNAMLGNDDRARPVIVTMSNESQLIEEVRTSKVCSEQLFFLIYSSPVVLEYIASTQVSAGAHQPPRLL